MTDWESKPSRTSKRRRSSSGASTSKDIQAKSPKASTLRALIVDSGGYTVKIGYSKDEEPHVIPNCIMKAKSERKRLFIGKQIEECRDCSGLYFMLPCERGYITRWEVQKPVWDQMFSRNVCPIEDNPVILTQPLLNFKSIQDCIDEIFFEEYEVPSLFRCNPSDLAYLNYAKEHRLTRNDACLVVDTGFSFTHIVPYIKGNKFLRAVRRLNVGGKLLTNHLKDIISYRQYNVMEETYVINQVKEDTCYVCEDVKKELVKASRLSSSNSIVRNYVLPDFNTIRRGYIQESNQKEQEDNCQILRLNNERFVVPEILFHPSDIGMKSMGISEAIVKSIYCSPQEHRQSLAKHIILAGGNCKFPGFKERLYSELRSLLPDAWQVNVYLHEDPITYAWKGGGALLRTHDFRKNLITKQDYEELGPSIIQDRFANFMLDDSELEKAEDDQKQKGGFRYLPRLQSPSIFGKSEALPSMENEQMDIDEGSSNSSNYNNGYLDEVNSGAVEDDNFPGVEAKRPQGRPSRNKEVKEADLTEATEESSEDNLTQSSELFPFGIRNYL